MHLVFIVPQNRGFASSTISGHLNQKTPIPRSLLATLSFSSSRSPWQSLRRLHRLAFVFFAWYLGKLSDTIRHPLNHASKTAQPFARWKLIMFPERCATEDLN